MKLSALFILSLAAMCACSALRANGFLFESPSCARFLERYAEPIAREIQRTARAARIDERLFGDDLANWQRRQRWLLWLRYEYAKLAERQVEIHDWFHNYNRLVKVHLEGGIDGAIEGQLTYAENAARTALLNFFRRAEVEERKALQGSVIAAFGSFEQITLVRAVQLKKLASLALLGLRFQNALYEALQRPEVFAPGNFDIDVRLDAAQSRVCENLEPLIKDLELDIDRHACHGYFGPIPIEFPGFWSDRIELISSADYTSDAFRRELLQHLSFLNHFGLGESPFSVDYLEAFQDHKQGLESWGEDDSFLD